MGSVVPFRFQRGDAEFEVRTVALEGEWFVGLDVASILGYSDPDQAIRKHCKALKRFNSVELTELGFVEAPPSGLVLIPERDVYRLVMRSRLPDAVRFEEWVVGEVLPSIRRSGTYVQTYEGAVTLQQLDERLEPIHLGMGEIKRDVTELKSGQKRIGEQVQAIYGSRRRDFDETKVKKPVRFGVLEFNKGMCLRCDVVRIVDDVGDGLPTLNYDHNSGPSDHTIKNCLPVCGKCNIALKDASERMKVSSTFEWWQGKLSRWLPFYFKEQKDKQPLKPRKSKKSGNKKSGPIFDARQSGLSL